MIPAVLGAITTAALLLAPVQRPDALSSGEPGPAESTPTETTPTPTETAPADSAAAQPAEATPAEVPASEATPAEAAPSAPAETAPSAPAEAEPATVTDGTAAEASASAQSEGTLTAATERPGPPFYSEADLAAVRERHELDPASPPGREPARWRCLIADPTCRFTFEINATAAYARRFRQGDVQRSDLDRWNSTRAQYDFWMNLPALVETEGKSKYTRLSLGPKGGVIFSDTGDLWGNVGIAARYWLGRGRWAPTIEFSSALSFKLGTREPATDFAEERFRMQRGPVGFTADVGVGLGGFGAIVIGGQYDSPLAREEIPEELRVVSSGMFYVGFRGNILWGGPAAAAVLAHGLTRTVNRP